MPSYLYTLLAEKVQDWSDKGYPCDYPALQEILEWSKEPDGSGFRLRPPQIRALETYWYLRVVENTPLIFDLYKKVFPPDEDPDLMLEALGISQRAFQESKYQFDILWDKIKDDTQFVKTHRLNALRETLNLDYPSYIFALAMGAGKTALIGAIIAQEFGMAREYPDGPFVQNALVFAPGKTIIESLREIAALPYERILPKRIYKEFAASVKLTFTRDGDPDIPIIENSVYNIVVTNTEKIRIQKEAIRKSDIGSLFASAEKEDEAKREIANRRLRKIASLPHLAIFSDEAHHTYGQSLETELKKVRKTVDYLHKESPNLICVVNTTGTPYFKRQLLRDVVIWYGLSEGINDGILKEVSDNILAFDFSNDVEQYLAFVVEDFFKEYGDTTLPDGTPAKLALYFPQTDDVETYRPVIETKLLELGLPQTLILEHHTANENKEDFDRFKTKDSNHRIALLVNRGTEGWNVPALFACALARRLTGSNNFVLQAASRCLRQIPGNSKKARIYLSLDNRDILDRQLQETYGQTIGDINRTQRERKYEPIKLRKHDIPPLCIRRIIKTVVRIDSAKTKINLHRPYKTGGKKLKKIQYTVSEQISTQNVLKQVGDEITLESVPAVRDVYAVSVELASNYHLDLWELYDELKRIYPDGDVPEEHITGLQEQIEEQTRNYEEREETVERALALVKLDGFTEEIDAEGNQVYTAEISYPIDREILIQHLGRWKDRTGGYGFHYTPYNFDSQPELSFFENMLREIQVDPDDIEDIYFTGAITDPEKTDFYIEYKGEDGNWHRYTPDFIIRKKDGKCLILEIKDSRFEAATNDDLERHSRGEHAKTTEGRKAIALLHYQNLNPEKLKYEIVYAKNETIPHDSIKEVHKLIISR